MLGIDDGCYTAILLCLGVVIGISDSFRIPVRYIGIGEGIDQLKIFDRHDFVKALFGK